MFQSGLFWLLLAGTVAVFWALPRRYRMAFLALVSIAYVTVQGSWTIVALQGTLLMTAALLAWAMAFFCLAPLAVSVRPSAPVRTVSMPVTSSAIELAASATGGVSTVVLPPLSAPVTPPRPRNRRWILWTLIGAILTYLAWFKYVMPLLALRATTGIEGAYVLPLGISYFTFKFIHYGVEVARGNIRDRSLWNYLCYVFFFPTFSEGPIERFDHFLKNCHAPWSRELMVQGITRIIHGLIKKFFIAEMLLGEDFRYAFYGSLAANVQVISAPHVWRIAIVSYLYLYMDFSGYCDIALGAARLFGITIMENFYFPIFAGNIGDFWKRWHMTLSGWCQTYVYMPVLGWTRRPNLATYASFIAIGVWHSAMPKWILWGAYHATGLVVYQKWVRTRRKRKWGWAESVPWRLAGIGLTQLFVSAGDLLTFSAVTGYRDIVAIMGRLAFVHIRLH